MFPPAIFSEYRDKKVPMSNKAKVKQIMSGTMWVSIYTGLFRLMTLLVSIMSARLLNVDDYGKVSIMQSTAALFIMFATMGLGTVATKLVAEKGAYYLSSINLISYSLCFISTLAIFLSAEWIANSIYQEPSLGYLLELLAVYIFFSAITQIQSSVLAGKEQYAIIAKINLIVGVSSILVVFLMIKQFGVEGWLYGLSILEVIKFVFLQLVISKNVPALSEKISKVKFLHVSKLALPIAISGFFVLPLNWYLTKELLITAGYLDVAVLNISDQWVAILTFFPIAIGNAMLPILSKMKGGGERKKLSDMALKINVGLALVITTPTLFLGAFIMSFYGQSYVDNAQIFFYLMPLVVVLSLTNQLNNRVIADGRPALMMYSNILWLIICLPVAMWLLSIEWGVLAILVGRLVAYSGKLLFLHLFTRRTIVV